MDEDQFAEMVRDLKDGLDDVALEHFKRVTIKRLGLIGEVARAAKGAGLSQAVTDEIASDLWEVLFRGYDGA
ncbi:hypothetical protein C9F11_10035 [Streptomyces sp. YIM 121038]|uniref:hypothetical protein n=1 Tax=Streptomyces sp. YIM 121038 TaxID=2136401 RepID=UPI001110288A|nr:hypothetical protein [Streptomyces sp. YIM 121038]QCX75690.1 hypothetical protein C9F11_10035 [Streptomyces sp. YIM 121038]